ncbi:MAG: Uma2 family endonuclease [Gemmataceae bacterium]|nr:Uma2 family endonuclease [Gemmataceae bacterium]
MTALPKEKYTEAEYLARERAAEYKSEFLDGEIFAMSGASYFHNLVKENLVGELFQQLKGSPCRTLSSDMKVKVEATGLIAYPDVVALCGEPKFLDDRRDVLLNPVVVVEVLSPSTEKYDRRVKLRHYQRIPTLTDVVLMSQDEPFCERLTRQDNGTWVAAHLTELTEELTFGGIPARVPLAAIYAGLTFPPPLGEG